MSLQIVREPLPADVFNGLCRSGGWNEVPVDNYNLAVANGIACVSAFFDTRAVWCGRLVGDVGMYLYIRDLSVRRFNKPAFIAC